MQFVHGAVGATTAEAFTVFDREAWLSGLSAQARADGRL